MPATWRNYYEKWRETTRERIDLRMLELMPPLAALAPPATVIDKPVYSAFAGHKLQEYLQKRHVDGLIITGSETDVCGSRLCLPQSIRAIGLSWSQMACAAHWMGPRRLAVPLRTAVRRADRGTDSETLLSLWPTSDKDGARAPVELGSRSHSCSFKPMRPQNWA